MDGVFRPELERLIERKLATGRYTDRDAVIEEALELLRQQDIASAALENALEAAHQRNARLDLDTAEALVEAAIKADRLQRR